MVVNLFDVSGCFDYKEGLNVNYRGRKVLELEGKLEFMVKGEEKRVYRYKDKVVLDKNHGIKEYYKMIMHYYSHKIAEVLFDRNTPKLRGVVAVPYKCEWLKDFSMEGLEGRYLYVVDYVDGGKEYREYVEEFYEFLRKDMEDFVAEKDSSKKHEQRYEKEKDRIERVVEEGEKYGVYFNYSLINVCFVDNDFVFVELVEPHLIETSFRFGMKMERYERYGRLLESVDRMDISDDKKELLEKYILGFRRASIFSDSVIDIEKINKILENNVLLE